MRITIGRGSMIDLRVIRSALHQINAASPFNRLAGIKIVEVEAGTATLELQSRDQLLNQAGTLHVGVQAALLETACAFAGGTVAEGYVVTVQASTSFMAAARGDCFRARATVRKAGKNQIFADADLVGLAGGSESLIATGSFVLARVQLPDAVQISASG
jgi:uncharacterized protein (TIGR00369 family)